MNKKLRIASLCVQGGYEPKNGEPIEVPIIQSTTFKYDNSEEMAMLFDLKKEGYFYTRLQNPTNDAVAKKIAELEGVWEPCSQAAVRLPTSMPYSTSARLATISLHPMKSMVAPSTSLVLPSRNSASNAPL